MKDRAEMSYGEKYGPAMEITDQAEADKYFEVLVQHSVSFGITTRAESEIIERQNLGYFAGYCDNATRARVERLFKCEHPVFGKIAINGAPTPEEAYEAGFREALKQRVGSALKEKGLI